MLITDQVATAPCTDPIQVRFLLLRQAVRRRGPPTNAQITLNLTMRDLLRSVALCLVQVYPAIVSQQENVSGREPAVVLRVDRT